MRSEQLRAASGPNKTETSTDSSIFCLLQFQHPLSSGQVVHLLKSFNLGGKKQKLINLPVVDEAQYVVHIHMT